MTKENGEKIRAIYGIFIALFSAVIGVLFVVQVWRIYRAEPMGVEQAHFSRARVAEYFRQIAIPVWFYVAALIGGTVLTWLYPTKPQRLKATVDSRTLLLRTKKRLPTAGALAERSLCVEKTHKKFRVCVFAVCAGLVLTAAIVAALILFGVISSKWISWEFFVANDRAADKITQCAFYAFLSLALVSVAIYLYDGSMERERNAYLEIIKEGKKGDPVRGESPKREIFSEKTKEKGVFIARISLAVIGVAFVCIGIWNGGMADVLAKAINICTQCIGLG